MKYLQATLILLNSNDKIKNPNTNVLEFIAKQKGFDDQIADLLYLGCFSLYTEYQTKRYLCEFGCGQSHFSDPSLELINNMQFLTARPLDETGCDDIFRRKRIFKSI